MKKRLFHIGIIGVLALAACSCTEDVLPARVEDYIRFGMPGMEVEAKSTLVNGTLPEGSQFGVLGYCLAQVAPDNPELNASSGSVSWDTKKELCRPHLFYKKTVTYSGGACTYADPVPWFEPANYQYTFFAYYPYGNSHNGTDSYFTVESGQGDLGSPIVKFSMPFNGGDTLTPLDDSRVPDAMVAMAEDVTRGTNGMVELNFRHILTGLNFQINNYNEDPQNPGTGDRLIVHSLKLRGTFYKSFVMNYDDGWECPAGETFSGTYTLLPDGSDKVVEAQDEGLLIDKTLLFVSGQNSEGAATGYLGPYVKLEIKYTFGDSREKTQWISRPENFLPVGGTVYTSQLNFIGNAFVLNIIVDNNYQWEDGGDSEIVFE